MGGVSDRGATGRISGARGNRLRPAALCPQSEGDVICLSCFGSWGFRWRVWSCLCCLALS